MLNTWQSELMKKRLLSAMNVQIEPVPESLARRFGLRIQGMMDLNQAVISEHARVQMGKRQISEADVRTVLHRPESIVAVRVGRVVAQSVTGGYLLRVFVDVDRQPLEVVTVYRTSKIDKYRS